MVSPAFERIEPLVRSELTTAYRCVGDLAFAFAAGSLVEGFTDHADLDLIFVWNQDPPASAERLPLELIDEDPFPAQFEEPNFNLDRFWLDGQQIDAKHVSLTDFRSSMDDVTSGEGTTGYPMPAIVAHALVTGVIIFDGVGIANEIHAQLTPPSETYITATRQRWQAARPEYFNELSKAAERGDGLLFADLAVQALRLAFIAWFARQGHYWPHEKRLNLRLRNLGHPQVAELEEAVWNTPDLEQRHRAIGDLTAALFPDT